MTETTRPAHPPMDGDATDDIGMMSTPMRLEHGDAEAESTPALSFGFEVECDADDAGRAYAFVESRYACPNPFDGPGPWWNVTDDGDAYGVDAGKNPGDEHERVRLPLRIEFSAGPYTSDDEPIDAWVDRAIAGAPFDRVYNDAVIFYTLQHELDDHLKPQEG